MKSAKAATAPATTPAKTGKVVHHKKVAGKKSAAERKADQEMHYPEHRIPRKALNNWSHMAATTGARKAIAYLAGTMPKVKGAKRIEKAAPVEAAKPAKKK